MNARKSKDLRRSLGFHPAAEREYRDSNPRGLFHKGTRTTTGARRQYQGAKRAGMAGYILGAI